MVAGQVAALKSNGKVAGIGSSGGQTTSAATGTPVEFWSPESSTGDVKGGSGTGDVAYDGSQYAIATAVLENGDHPFFQVFSISGTTATKIGSTATLVSGNIDSDFPAGIVYDSSIGRFVASGRGRESSNNGIHAYMIALDSSGSPTMSTIRNNGASGTYAYKSDLVSLNDGRQFAVNYNTNDNLELIIMDCDPTNDTISFGSAYEVTGSGQNKPFYTKYVNGKIIILYRAGSGGSSSDDVWGVVVTPDATGTGMTVGTPYKIVDVDYGSNYLAADVSDAGKVLIAGSSGRMLVGSVSGTSFTSFTATTGLTTPSQKIFADIVLDAGLRQIHSCI